MKMAREWLLLCVLWALVSGVSAQSAPNFCSYIEGQRFECDYTGMISTSDRPINYGGFSPVPQQLEVTMNGLVPYFGDTQVFSSSFSGIDTSQFDNNYPASVTIDCGLLGGIFMYTGAFADMSHVQYLKIKNCIIYEIPSNAFADFQSLDYFGIEFGDIQNVHPDAWVGLNVEKLTSGSHSFPRFLGKFEIMYSPFPTTYVPPGLLYNMKNLTSATLRGVGISTLAKDVFRYNTKIRYIDVGDNDFTSIPTGLFDGLNSLAEFRAQNINWDCSCTSNWFVPYSVENNITFIGDFICSTGVGVFEYYYSNCIDNTVCGDATGFAMGDHCVGVLAVVAAILGLSALVMATVALVIIVMAKKAEAAEKSKRIHAVGRWNKVIDSMLAWKKR